MPPMFETVGLIGKPNHSGASESLRILYKFLKNQGCNVLVEERVANVLWKFGTWCR